MEIGKDEVVDIYTFGNNILGTEVAPHKGGDNYFLCSAGVDENSVIEMLESLSIDELLYLENRHKGLHYVAERWEVDPTEYIDDADLQDYIDQQGYSNIEELKGRAPRVWYLIDKRVMAQSLFSGCGARRRATPCFEQEE